MKHCMPIFLAIIGFIHFSHIASTAGILEDDIEELYTADSNTTTAEPSNVTTVNPTTEIPSSDTTTASPSNDTTTASPSNKTTTASPPIDTTTPSPSNDTTTPSSSNGTTTTPAPGPHDTTTATPKAHSSGRSFDGASFVGGIILGLGVLIIAFVGYRLYHRRRAEGYNAM